MREVTPCTGKVRQTHVARHIYYDLLAPRPYGFFFIAYDLKLRVTGRTMCIRLLNSEPTEERIDFTTTMCVFIYFFFVSRFRIRGGRLGPSTSSERVSGEWRFSTISLLEKITRGKRESSRNNDFSQNQIGFFFLL